MNYQFFPRHTPFHISFSSNVFLCVPSKPGPCSAGKATPKEGEVWVNRLWCFHDPADCKHCVCSCVGPSSLFTLYFLFMSFFRALARLQSGWSRCTIAAYLERQWNSQDALKRSGIKRVAWGLSPTQTPLWGDQDTSRSAMPLLLPTGEGWRMVTSLVHREAQKNNKSNDMRVSENDRRKGKTTQNETKAKLKPRSIFTITFLSPHNQIPSIHLRNTPYWLVTITMPIYINSYIKTEKIQK